jgi:hypothetical protein
VTIFGAISYPFADPLAQQLLDTLIRLNPTPREAQRAAEDADLRPWELDLTGPVADQWRDILRKAAQGGILRELVTSERDRLPATHPRRGFLDDVLADRPTPVANEPRDAAGRPAFLEQDEVVMEDEALLFKDDLTLQIGEVPRLIATLQRLLKLAPAVCLLHVQLPARKTWGTAFRIAGDRLLTNWHVLHARDTGERAITARAEFEFEEDEHGAFRPSVGISCDVATIVTNRDDDWAVITPTQPLRPHWPVIRLSGGADPAVGEPAYIVQHPNRQRKRVGFVRNHISFFDERVLHYLTDTEPGSSGSPIFNAAGQLIGLHHVGGTPQDLTGVPPVVKNEGIRIPRVVSGLKNQGVDVP